MIKTKTLMMAFIASAFISGCSSLDAMSDNISKSFTETGGHIKQMATEPFKETYSDEQIIEKSLYDGFNLANGVLQMYRVNEEYRVKLNKVSVTFDDGEFGPMTTEFKGIIMIDSVDGYIKTPITFVASNLLGSKNESIAGYKYRLVSVELDKIHIPIKASYEKALERSLQNLLSLHLNGHVLIDLDKISGANKEIINGKNYRNKKYNPEIEYVN